MTNDNDERSEEETRRRAEEALKRMLQTPHKPHKPIGKKGAGRQADRHPTSDQDRKDRSKAKKASREVDLDRDPKG